MYRDPERLRSRSVKLWLTPEEDRLIEAIADYTGSQKSVLAREMLMSKLRVELMNSVRNEPRQEGAHA